MTWVEIVSEDLRYIPIDSTRTPPNTLPPIVNHVLYNSSVKPISYSNFPYLDSFSSPATSLPVSIGPIEKALDMPNWNLL